MTTPRRSTSATTSRSSASWDSADEDVRERITSCTELDQLETWIRRAATVGTARDLFAEMPE
jgi:hypothetical protein